MGLMPPAWTPNKTGQDLRKQDETRAGASARRVGCCCSDGAPHGFCFALLAMATRRPSRNPDRAPGSAWGRSHKDGAKEISSERTPMCGQLSCWRYTQRQYRSDSK